MNLSLGRAGGVTEVEQFPQPSTALGSQDMSFLEGEVCFEWLEIGVCECVASMYPVVSAVEIGVNRGKTNAAGIL